MPVARISERELLTNRLNERRPPVTKDLVAYFPLDGTAFDGVGGYNPIQATESGKNLLELHSLDWRDPANWERFTGGGTLAWDEQEQALVADGYGWWIFKGYISIDTAKHWYVGCRAKKAGPNGRFYLGDVSYNIDKGTTPQHPGTHEYFGASAAVVGSDWTAFLNSAIGGNPRTGTSTTTSDYTKFDPNCRFVRPLFIANYSNGVIGTDKVWVKDLTWYYSDENNATCELTDAGLYCEDPTTNAVTNWDLNTGWSQGYNQDISWNDITPPEGIDAPVVTFTDAGGNKDSDGSGYWYSYGDYAPQADGTQYQISLWARSEKEISISAYTGDNSETGRKWTEYLSLKPGKWTRLIWNPITTNNPNDSDSLSFHWTGLTGGARLSLCAPQMEPKFHPTLFCKGSRSGYGQLQIDNLKVTNFTLVFKFRPDCEYYKRMSSGYNKVMLQMFDTDLVRRIDYTDYKGSPGPSVTYSDPFFDLEPNASWDNLMHHWHHTQAYKQWQWHSYAIVKNGNTLRIRCVLDGQVLSDRTFTYSDSTALEAFTLTRLILGHSSNPWNGCFKDLAIYSRGLSDNELVSLQQAPLSLTNDGEARTWQAGEGQDLLKNRMQSYFHFDGQFANGWSKYEQTNCKVYASRGAHALENRYAAFIHRPANLVYPDCGNTTWGGLVCNMPQGIWVPGIKYRLSFYYRGHTNPNPVEIYWAYSVGWTSAGVGLNSPVVAPSIPPLNNVKDWQYYEYEFVCPNNIWQLGTDDNWYFCMNQFKIGFGYQSTDAIGTRFFIDKLEVTMVNETKGVKPDRIVFDEYRDGKQGHSLYVLGTSLLAGPVDCGGPRLVKVDGNEVVNSTLRGLTLTVFDSESMLLKSSQNYDAYGSDTDRTNLAAALAAIAADEIWCLSSYDAFATNTTLTAQMTVMGATLFQEIHTAGGVRHTYACVGRGQQVLIEDGSNAEAVDKHYACITINV